MALLKSIKTVPGIDYYEYRDKEYYNKYKYKANFSLFGVQYLYRVENEKDLTNKLIASKASWFSIPDKHKDLVKQNFNELVAFIDWRKANTGKNKGATIRSETTNVSVFSNDLQLLKTLSTISPNITITFTEVQTSQYAGVKYFAREPKHKYRVYLQSKRITTGEIKELREFIQKNKELYPSSSMKSWLVNKDKYGWRQNWCSSTFSMDYDDDSTLSYMMLMYGEFIGKRYKLEKHPEL